VSTTSERPIFQLEAEITARTVLAPGYYHFVVRAPEIAAAAHPGQFVQLRVGTQGAIDPLLARPISILRTDPARGEMAVIFKTVGRGTALLSSRSVGESLTILGPIGNGFTIPPATTRLALVGGGVGMPPLYFLAETLRQTRPEMAITLYYGGRTAEDLLYLPEWEALGVNVCLTTDDGSRGVRGLITDALLADLSTFDFLAACGPRSMLQAVQRLALHAGIAGQLSLEARMACGVGACLGCVCATLKGNRRVCVDGPVFSLTEVCFDA